MPKKINNASESFKDWSTEKLKEEAKSLYQSIHIIECYNVKDLINYDSILTELSNRGIEPKLTLEFE
jgi:hypothetical protein